MNEGKNFERVNKIKKDNVEAIALLGSYARGEAKKYSDIDLVLLTGSEMNNSTTQFEIMDGKYLVMNYVTLKEVDSWFEEPEKATAYISGLRTGKPLWDPNNYFKNLKEQAKKFTWSNSLKEKANEYASKELVSWIEEVHKALQGLISNDVGRMLNGIFGLTYGLFSVIRVQRGILLTGDNSFFEQVINEFKNESDFIKLANEAFGLDSSFGIKERVISGLRLFDLYTDIIIDDIVGEKNKKLILLTKKEIKKELNK